MLRYTAVSGRENKSGLGSSLMLTARLGMPGYEYGINGYQTVLDKGQGCDWIIQS